MASVRRSTRRAAGSRVTRGETDGYVLFGYDSASAVSTIFDSMGPTIFYGYDAFGRTTAVADRRKAATLREEAAGGFRHDAKGSYLPKA